MARNGVDRRITFAIVKGAAEMSVTIQEPHRRHAVFSKGLVVWRDPDRLGGTPCFAGTRVPVVTLFDYLESGDSLDDFLDEFPGVSRDQAIGALRIGKDELLDETAGR